MAGRTFRLVAMAVFLTLPVGLCAQLNTSRIMSIGRTALYYDDFVLSIQYFNQVISAKPYLYEPYFYRAVAKLSLDDWYGAEEDCSKSIERNPFVVNSYQVRGLARVYQKKYSDAISDFYHGLALDPENRPMRHNLILSLMRDGKREQAMLAADTLLQIAPSYTPAMSMLAEMVWAEGDTAKALEWMERAVSIDRFDPELINERGMMMARADMLIQAEEEIERAIYLDRSNADFYINRAMVRYYRNNLRGALQDYDIALDLEPSNLTGRYNRGNLRAQTGDDNRAIEDFDIVIEAEPDNYPAIFNRAILRHNTGDFRGAENDLTRVLEEYPEFISGYQLRSEVRSALGDRKGAESDALVVLRDQNRRFNAAHGYADKTDSDEKSRKSSDKNVANYRKIIVDDDLENATGYSSEYRGKVQNRNVEAQFLSLFHFSYFRSNSSIDRQIRNSVLLDHLNAYVTMPGGLSLNVRDEQLNSTGISSLFSDIDRLTAMISESGNERVLELKLLRGVDFALLQDFSSAEQDFNDVIKADPTKWMAWFCRAYVNARGTEANVSGLNADGQTRKTELSSGLLSQGYQSVIRDLTEVIELQPEFVYAYYNRGTMYAMAGDYHAALVDFDKALELDASLSEAWFNRGLVNAMLNRMDQAFADLGKAGELGMYQAYNIIKRFSR